MVVELSFNLDTTDIQGLYDELNDKDCTPDLLIYYAPRGNLEFNVGSHSLGNYHSRTGKVPLIEFAGHLNHIANSLEIGQTTKIWHVEGPCHAYFMRKDEDTILIKTVWSSEWIPINLEELKTASRKFCEQIYEYLAKEHPAYIRRLEEDPEYAKKIWNSLSVGS